MAHAPRSSGSHRLAGRRILWVNILWVNNTAMNIPSDAVLRLVFPGDPREFRTLAGMPQVTHR
jgi:hypothetical protein